MGTLFQRRYPKRRRLDFQSRADVNDLPADLAQIARRAMLEGDIRPMAKWLRTLDSLNAIMLAEAIEGGTLTYDISHRLKTEVNKLMCGRYVVEQLEAGVKSKEVFESAEAKFGMSRRNVERSKADWLKQGRDDLSALRVLAGPLADEIPAPPKVKKNGGDV